MLYTLRKSKLYSYIFPIATLGWSVVSQASYLDPADRPEDLKKRIQSTFEEISSKEKGTWFYNGVPEYKPFGKDDMGLLKVIIQENTQKGEKDIYILDIGAGNYEKNFWAKAKAQALNNDDSISSDLTFHFVSLTGENYSSEIKEKEGKCKLYNLAAFNIEEMKDNFNKLNLSFDNKFSLIVSRYSFVHFHDPVGTYAQAYNFLKPKTGYMFVDGFSLFYSGAPSPKQTLRKKYDFKDNMLEFLENTNTFFILNTFRDPSEETLHGMYEFAVMRLDRSPCELSLSYTDESLTYTKSEKSPGNNSLLKAEGDFIGYRRLHDFLKRIKSN